MFAAVCRARSMLNDLCQPPLAGAVPCGPEGLQTVQYPGVLVRGAPAAGGEEVLVWRYHHHRFGLHCAQEMILEPDTSVASGRNHGFARSGAQSVV